MGVSNILFYPDERLSQTCQKVTDFDNEAPKLASNLRDTLKFYTGLGLAASQIGEMKRAFVLDLAALKEEEDFEPKLFINPSIIDQSGQESFLEGCLSIPGVTEDIDRSLYVKVKAYDEEGNPFEYEASGYTAAAIQHELDHLDGILIFDRVSRFKKQRLLKKYKKFRKKMYRSVK